MDPIRSGANWYVYVGNDPVNWVDLLGLDNIELKFDRSKDQMTVKYEETTSYGKVIETYTKTYPATNNVRDREEPNVMTIPASGKPKNYYPQNFPNGKYELTGTTSPNNNALGPRSIQTNATQEVQTYDYNKNTESWTPSGTQTDTGYSIHGGGYTNNDQYSPLGNNRVEDNTFGCIRLCNTDIEELADLVDTVHDTNGSATLEVTDGQTGKQY